MSTPADDPTFHRLGWRDGLALAGTLVLGRVWVAVDQELLPQRLLMPAFFAVVLLLQAGFFVFVRPARPFALARTVALTLGTATAALILVQHVVMTYDLSYKAGIIFGATVALPFVVAAIYRWTSR